VTTAQMAEVDRRMIEEFGIQLVQMMENAGRALAEQASRMLGGRPAARPVVVLCGAGNNGGGGMVAARHLHNRGAIVQAKLVGDAARLTDVPAHQWRILKVMGLAMKADPDLAQADLRLLLEGVGGDGDQGDQRVPLELRRAGAPGDAQEGLPRVPEPRRMIHVEGLNKRYGERILFEDVSWHVKKRDRIGLSGPNGSGKTTLLRMLAGLQEADSGQIRMASDTTIGYLPQDGIVHHGRSVYDEVVLAFEEILACRTAVLGGHLDVCEECGFYAGEQRVAAKEA